MSAFITDTDWIMGITTDLFSNSESNNRYCSDMKINSHIWGKTNSDWTHQETDTDKTNMNMDQI